MEQTRRILETGAAYGLVPKIHANELDYSGGIRWGWPTGPCRWITLSTWGGGAEGLASGRTMPTLLPGASLFLGMDYARPANSSTRVCPWPWPQFQSGFVSTGNMELILSLGLMQLRMLPMEVLHAATLNRAYAMGLGSVTDPSRWASRPALWWPMPSFGFMPYSYGSGSRPPRLLNGIRQTP
ncbi:MAG: hypothetical protein R2751_08310 [Bacteroidales bacterium]